MGRPRKQDVLNRETFCDIDQSISFVRSFFANDEKLISLYMSVQEEMWKCDPDLKFCSKNGLIGLSKKDEKYRFFIAPSEDSYDIKFAHIEGKKVFCVENNIEYIKECEKCIFYILKHPESVNSKMVDDTELSDISSDVILNRNQRKFCKSAASKNIRLLAPAGSGKTFSLLWKCKFITEDYAKKGKVPPYFLIVTFTRAASAELENRLKSNSEFKNIRATVRTLNSWGNEQIRVANKSLVTNKVERTKLVFNDLNSVINKFPGIFSMIKSSRTKYRNAELIIDLIDLLKSLGFDHCMTKAEYKNHCRQLKELGLLNLLNESYIKLLNAQGIDILDKKKSEQAISDFFKFWKKSVVKLNENLRYTLEDQKYWALQILKSNIEQKKFPKGVVKYSHILIDEFQDINPLDMTLINAISIYHGAGKKTSITIVGDDDQAIFGWRGTTPKYILYPEKYMGCSFETIVLNENYRSPKKIVELSRKLIEHNKERAPKELKSKAHGKPIVNVISRQKYMTVVDATIRKIRELIDENGCKNVAVIGRKQAAIFPYQIMLSSEGTNYSVDADIDIFSGEAMKSLHEIIKIVYRAKDCDNDSICKELLQMCNKIFRYELSKVEESQIIRYLEERNPEDFMDALEILRTYPEEIKGYPAEKLYEILYDTVSADTVYQFMQRIVEDFEGLSKDYNKADEDNHYKEPQFFRLTEVAKKYGDDFRKFWKDIDKAQRNVCAEDSKITLITATRSKGHEYDGVIILDCYDNEWPNSLAEDIEEERRLMYVAMTRAKKYLYFISSSDKEQSRFISEMGLS